MDRDPAEGTVAVRQEQIRRQRIHTETESQEMKPSMGHWLDRGPRREM